MRIYTLFVYVFLYTPIAIIALFSFSAGRSASQFEGFSVKWYGRALDNPFVMDALGNSLFVAFVSATLAVPSRMITLTLAVGPFLRQDGF